MRLSHRLLLVPFLLAGPALLAQQGVLAPTPAPRPQDEPPVWATTFPEAVERARALHDGRVFVEITDASCSECDRMQKLVYPSASFRALMRDKVAVSLDRSSADGERIAGRFGIRSAPAWLILTPDLLLCGLQEGATNQPTWMARFAASEQKWAQFRKKLDDEKKSPGDFALVFEVAQETYARGGDQVAEERFRRLAVDAKAPAELREKSDAYLAAIALDSRRFDDAQKSLERILATSKNGSLREQAELRMADVEVGRGERAKAVDRLRRFLEKNGASPLRPQAEELLKALGAEKQ